LGAELPRKLMIALERGELAKNNNRGRKTALPEEENGSPGSVRIFAIGEEHQLAFRRRKTAASSARTSRDVKASRRRETSRDARDAQKKRKRKRSLFRLRCGKGDALRSSEPDYRLNDRMSSVRVHFARARRCRRDDDVAYQWRPACR